MDGWMNDELGKIWKEAAVSQYAEIIPAFALERRENPLLSVRMSGVSTEIRTRHLPNTATERYRYANPPGFTVKICG
jgi:hypothetical protein